MIDSGAEFDVYASDVTRTWPVNGKFSAEQRAIYDIVLRAQKAGIDQVRPGRSFNAYHDAAVRARRINAVVGDEIVGDLPERRANEPDLRGIARIDGDDVA